MEAQAEVCRLTWRKCKHGQLAWHRKVQRPDLSSPKHISPLGSRVIQKKSVSTPHGRSLVPMSSGCLGCVAHVRPSKRARLVYDICLVSRRFPGCTNQVCESPCGRLWLQGVIILSTKDSSCPFIHGLIDHSSISMVPSAFQPVRK